MVSMEVRVWILRHNFFTISDEVSIKSCVVKLSSDCHGAVWAGAPGLMVCGEVGLDSDADASAEPVLEKYLGPDPPWP